MECESMSAQSLTKRRNYTLARFWDNCSVSVSLCVLNFDSLDESCVHIQHAASTTLNWAIEIFAVSHSFSELH